MEAGNRQQAVLSPGGSKQGLHARQRFSARAVARASYEPKIAADFCKSRCGRTKIATPSHVRLGSTPKHPWTNGQADRMNPSIKDATIERFLYETHDELRTISRLGQRLQLRKAH